MKKLPKSLLIVGSALLLVAAGIAATVGYLNSQQRAVPIVFSDNAMLVETWKAYKKAKIEPTSGRTIDVTQNSLTTSEGQSYTMLRAVWMDDRETFDKSWQFTRDNLQRPDKLFSWKYGALPGGGYGVQKSIGGENTASDADADIALSLMMAYTRWNETKYLDAARPIVTNIWDQEVVMVDGKPVMTADNLEKDSPLTVVVNPSYFAFANYKVFSMIDRQHDWNALSANSYDLLNRLSEAKLDKASSDGLPPNWITIERASGEFIPAATASLDTNFGYDAIRIPFRLALDYSWFKDGRDKETLSRFGFLKQFWQNTHVLNAAYAHDGKVVSGYESPAMYGATIGYFAVMDKDDAKDIYKNKLQTLYSPDQQSWKAPAPAYYEDNWAWFGIAFMQGALPNLTESK